MEAARVGGIGVGALPDTRSEGDVVGAVVVDVSG